MRRILIAIVGAFLCAFVVPVRADEAQDLEGPTKPIFDKGVAAYDAGQFEDAFKIFSSIEDQNIAAMYNAAYMLRRGQGTAKDPKGAAKLFARAAQAGDTRGAADLGEMLLKGEMGEPNLDAAVQWLTAAAAAHHPIAQFELAELYEEGRGVGKDIEVARDLYRQAAERGVPGAKERLAALPAPPSPPAAAPAAAPEPAGPKP